jgi:hypothetical protein
MELHLPACAALLVAACDRLGRQAAAA